MYGGSTHIQERKRSNKTNKIVVNKVITMIKVECTNEKYIGDGELEKCDYVLIKPNWEHIVNALYKQGGHAGKSICSKCNHKSLIFDFDYK